MPDVPPTLEGALAGRYRLERARLAEKMGERAVALREYRLVREAWREPDAVLMPYVREAEAGLERLATAPAADRTAQALPAPP